jgi:lipid-binding SYLF domain-containing protein
MYRIIGSLVTALLLFSGTALADKYDDTVNLFKNAGASSAFFGNSYGYAVFPTIGKAGFGIGGAHGKGRVFVRGNAVASTSMTQLSLGFQIGGQGFSQIIFFEDERSFREFSTGTFEFGAQASAVAITAGASASASTTGPTAGASGGKKDATTAGSSYYKGMKVFTITKGGLMYEASIGGQKFSYKPNAST